MKCKQDEKQVDAGMCGWTHVYWAALLKRVKSSASCIYKKMQHGSCNNALNIFNQMKVQI